MNNIINIIVNFFLINIVFDIYAEPNYVYALAFWMGF